MRLSRRVHLLSTPNVQVTKDYYLDVFSGFTRRFSELLTELGWTVFLYGSEEYDCPAQEAICCISKARQAELLEGHSYHEANYHPQNPMWIEFNQVVSAEIQKRKQAGDLLAIAAGAGVANLAVWNQHSEMTCLEYSIGYKGIFAPYRIYQSHAWRHLLHGIGHADYGRPYDDVIYHWFHEDEFPIKPVDDYVLYVGRLVASKGLTIVCNAAKAAGVPLYIIGDGDPSLVTYGDYLGHMPPDARNQWMAGARALLAPTNYIEPSACVATEAQLCGTPVIATPWGGFTEYVEDGKTGFLCKSAQEFTDAIRRCDGVDRRYVRSRAQRLYGWAAGVEAYRRYFARLESDAWDNWDQVAQLDAVAAGG